jgi:hypothetical protein
MREEILQILNQKEDYFYFLREYPYFYRLLNFYPQEINTFIEQYKIIKRKRIVDKVEDLSLLLSLSKELM